MSPVAEEADPVEDWEEVWDLARLSRGPEWLGCKATGWQEAVSPGARHSLGGEPLLASHLGLLARDLVRCVPLIQIGG